MVEFGSLNGSIFGKITMNPLQLLYVRVGMLLEPISFVRLAILQYFFDAFEFISLGASGNSIKSLKDLQAIFFRGLDSKFSFLASLS